MLDQFISLCRNVMVAKPLLKFALAGVPQRNTGRPDFLFQTMELRHSVGSSIIISKNFKKKKKSPFGSVLY